MNEASLLNDLAFFADLGTGPPQMMPACNHRSIVRMFRGGEPLELEFRGNGKIIERSPDSGEVRTHASYKALLASEKFANLRQWADSQRTLLNDVPDAPIHHLRVSGTLTTGDGNIGPKELDDFMASLDAGSGRVEVVLIDGPAGIGKTRFIEALASMRAREFLARQRPLVLHVESRGRVLTFLQDLLAFSLQRMRVSVTFDQVPILVRHGLVTLAIDGFDELGDPSGYEHAWGQLNELIREVRGEGVIILAGRDTFIDPVRIRRDIKSLRCRDGVNALTLQPPTQHDAEVWLRGHGWNEVDLDSVSELFEPGSYALRPFFLAQLAVPEIAAIIKEHTAGTPLAFLVELMISREVDKFGSAVEAVMNSEKRHTFVRDFLREVARFMADDQTEAVDEVALTWMVEISLEHVAPELVDSETQRLLQNRALVMAFFVKDDARNHRRFAHSQIFNHFLGEETLDTISGKEVPKFIRRNILAADFLAAFGDFVMYVVQSGNAQRIGDFFESASELVRTYRSSDRTDRNLGALLITVLPAMHDADSALELGPLAIDDAILKDSTAPEATLNRVVVSQIDLRGSDVRALTFRDCEVVTLIADDATRWGRSFPVPSLIRYEDRRGQRTIANPQEIANWIEGSDWRPTSLADQVRNDVEQPDHPLLKLLERACRNRSYWIRLDESDTFAARLVDDQDWGTLVGLLRRHDLTREDVKPSGGGRSRFLHIKRPMDILKNAPDDDQIRSFYQSLYEEMEIPGYRSDQV